MNHAEQHSKNKPWYKKWWGIIFLISVWPITIIWLIWSKTKWSKKYKVVATILFLIIAIGLTPPDEKEKNTRIVNKKPINVAKTIITPTPEPQKTLNISYNDIMNYLSNAFVMQKTSQVKGQDRWMGQADNQLAMLELIGDKNNLSSTFLMIGVPNDAPDIIVENSAIFVRFVKNNFPEWSDSDQWAINIIHELAQNPNQPIEKTYNNKAINISANKALGMISVSVKPL